MNVIGVAMIASNEFNDNKFPMVFKTNRIEKIHKKTFTTLLDKYGRI